MWIVSLALLIHTLQTMHVPPTRVSVSTTPNMGHCNLCSMQEKVDEWVDGGSGGWGA